MMKKINLTAYMVLLALGILFTSLVGAFSVGSSYYPGKPLTSYPGETKTINLDLQNLQGGEDVTVRAILVAGSEVASVEEKDYSVPFGTESLKVPVTISIPSDAVIGTIYPVKVSFSEITSEEEGVVLGIVYEVAFDVLIAEQPLIPEEAKPINWTLWIIVVIIVVVILYFLLRKKKSEGKEVVVK